ncbi:helix-turn-helix domain-containing protein [Dactylosporangium sp. CA-139066]|uniref:helix-turn-helix domain-containing protein n=1 Tax=Dactylosporangium sp. CA-139066 TaxID=3239930 RepID=UPI003D8FA4FB
MSENAERVGRRIRQLREEQGWTQGELAVRLGRTQTAISYWESGRRAPGIDELVELAEQFGVTASELLPGPARARPIPALLRAVAEQVDATQLAKELEEFALAAQRRRPPAVRWRILAASSRDTAEALLATAGIEEPAVPVDQLITDCGIRLLQWDFINHSVDGLVVELDDGPAIGINKTQSPLRQRFTAAHELGHYLLRHTDRFHVDFGGDLSPGASGEHPDYDWRAERAANDFAANLLMPASMMRAAFARGPDIHALAAEFDVSTAAMGFRLTNLRLR